MRVLYVLARLMNDRHGVTVIEYALIGSIISIAATAAFITMGSELSTTFSNIATDF